MCVMLCFVVLSTTVDSFSISLVVRCLRIYVIYLSDALGGEKAARLMKERVQSIQALRRVSPPVKAAALLQQVSIPDDVLQDALAERLVFRSSVVAAPQTLKRFSACP